SQCDGRKLDHEGRAPVLAGALRRDGAAVQLRQVPRDREPDPQPPVRAGSRTVGLTKPLEDVLEELAPDSAAGVGDPDFEMRLEPLETDRYGPPGRRELDAVGEEVPYDLLQAVGVSGDQVLPVEDPPIEEDPDPLGFRRGTHRLAGRLDDRNERTLPHRKAQLPGDDSGDVEKIIDQLRLRDNVALDDLEAVRGLAVELAGLERARPP